MISAIHLNHYYFLWFYLKSNRYRNYYNIGSGLFIWLFLWVAMPFGLYANNLGSPLLLALFLFPFGLSWTLISYSFDFLFYTSLGVKQEERILASMVLWMFKVVALIHIIYFIRQILCDWNCFDQAEYLELWLACILLFAFTYVPFSLYARFKYFQNMLVRDSSGSQLFELRGEGNKTERVDLDDVLYIMADDNYVDIVHQSNGQQKKVILRATLSSMEDQLKNHSQFQRVHRKYLVNLRRAIRIDQNSIALKTGDATLEIPVSKKYEAALASLKS